MQSSGLIKRKLNQFQMPNGPTEMRQPMCQHLEVSNMINWDEYAAH